MSTETRDVEEVVIRLDPDLFLKQDGDDGATCLNDGSDSSEFNFDDETLVSGDLNPFLDDSDHEVSMHTCNVCAKDLREQILLSYHCHFAHGNVAPLTQCNQCKSNFKSINKFNRHIRGRAHNQVSIYGCPICDSFGLVNKYDTYDSKVSHVCLVHGEEALNKMKRIYLNKKSSLFTEWPCLLCNRIFRHREYSRKHIVIEHSSHLFQILQLENYQKPSVFIFYKDKLIKMHRHTPIGFNKKKSSATETQPSDGDSPPIKQRIRKKTTPGEIHNSFEMLETICDICGVKFLMHRIMIVHKLLIHKKPMIPFQCQVCGYRNISYSTFIYHFGRLHGKVMCQICRGFCLVSDGYENATELKEHQILVHKMSKNCPQNETKNLSICNLCGNKISYTKFARHMRLNHNHHFLNVVLQLDGPEYLDMIGKNTSRCLTCNQVFYYSIEMVIHKTMADCASLVYATIESGEAHSTVRRSVSPNDVEMNCCNICHVSFEESYLLIYHRYFAHSDLAPNTNVCETCGAYFNRIKNLNIHIRGTAHNEKSIYGCLVCDAYGIINKFPTLDKVLKHVAVIHGIESANYLKDAKSSIAETKCPLCFKVLSHRSKIRQHMFNLHYLHLFKVMLKLQVRHEYSPCENYRAALRKLHYGDLESGPGSLNKKQKFYDSIVDDNGNPNEENFHFASVSHEKDAMFYEQENSQQNDSLDCVECNVSFRIPMMLLVHKLFSHRQPILVRTCDECGYVSSDARKLALHVIACHKGILCQICQGFSVASQCYSDVDKLIKHQEEVHDLFQGSQNEVAAHCVTCNLCGGDMFNRNKISVHMRKNHTDHFILIMLKIKNIKLCLKVGMLRVHCQFCGSMFHYKIELEMHIEKSHPVVAVKMKEKLKIEIDVDDTHKDKVINTEQLCIKCDYESCEKTFRTNSNMRRHFTMMHRFDETLKRIDII